jgi:hypothetical protein
MSITDSDPVASAAARVPVALSSVSIVVPCFNEEPNVAAVVADARFRERRELAHRLRSRDRRRSSARPQPTAT